jgi:hypothetical protein
MMFRGDLRHGVPQVDLAALLPPLRSRPREWGNTQHSPRFNIHCVSTNRNPVCVLNHHLQRLELADRIVGRKLGESLFLSCDRHLRRQHDRGRALPKEWGQYPLDADSGHSLRWPFAQDSRSGWPVACKQTSPTPIERPTSQHRRGRSRPHRWRPPTDVFMRQTVDVRVGPSALRRRLGEQRSLWTPPSSATALGGAVAPGPVGSNISSSSGRGRTAAHAPCAAARVSTRRAR